MRLLVKSLLIVAMLIPAALPLRAQELVGPCDFALRDADVPAELEPDGTGAASFNLSDDPQTCERLFQVDWPGPSGLMQVRSLVLMAPSTQRAVADFHEYRLLLSQNGWQEIGAQPVGELGTVFIGNDHAAGVYAVHQLFQRGYVVALIEATGPLLRDNPEVVLDLARVVDARVRAEVRHSFGNPLRSGSVWPRVTAPTVVEEELLSGMPLIGQSIQLGGLSGLAALDAEGTSFVAVTDRGPSAMVQARRGRQLVMPLAGYTPSLVRIEKKDGQFRISSHTGLRLRDGYVNPRTGSAYVTGLPISSADPAAFDHTATTRWGTDPNGVDPEGLAVDPRDGSFWIVEEYGPSILHVSADGTILARLVPAGLALEAPGQNVLPVLPPELAKRRPDQSFEGVAVSPDGSRLFALMQAPLTVPDASSAEVWRNLRLVAVNISVPEQPVVDGVYVYRTEAHTAAGAPSQNRVTVGDLAAITATRLLVAEHDGVNGGLYKMVFRVDLAQATNLYGAGNIAEVLEHTGEGGLEAYNIAALPKTPMVNLAELGWRPASFEGLSVVDEFTIAVVDDNAYGFAGIDGFGGILATGAPTRLTLVHLPWSLVR